MKKGILLVILAVMLVIPANLTLQAAQGTSPQNPPMVELRFNSSDQGVSLPIQILLLMTALTFLPAVLMCMTSFTRIIVALHFLRQASGLQSVPNNQILAGLALFLTIFIMYPVGEKINSQALQPLLNNQIGYQEAASRTATPLREFMIRYTREKDIMLFLEIGKYSRPATPAEIPMQVLAPAFLISELKTSFQIGFLLFLPFLVIDIVVSAILLSMGMMMLPPVVISTPFKILLFVMVDGWNLIIHSLVRSFF